MLGFRPPIRRASIKHNREVPTVPTYTHRGETMSNLDPVDECIFTVVAGTSEDAVHVCGAAAFRIHGKNGEKDRMEDAVEGEVFDEKPGELWKVVGGSWARVAVGVDRIRAHAARSARSLHELLGRQPSEDEINLWDMEAHLRLQDYTG